MSIASQIEDTLKQLDNRASLVAVSKTYPAENISEAYAVGQRRFGESRPQELFAKWQQLPKDIEWHMIGHLQRNKVRLIMPFVAMIETLDSQRLAAAIDQEAKRCDRVVDCLLEIHVAQEQSKTGWDYAQLLEFVESGGFAELTNIRVRGVMGIASNTDDQVQVRADFEQLRSHKEALATYLDAAFDTLSMGMSHDFVLAVECGSTSVRVGSKIFGYRDYTR
ncbi:MAG: YggS family pyridoxal phosphate-dependent enzyme [Rikenellaceae bacterium]